MKKYERVREIFNACGNSQMRDVDIEEIETDDIESDLRQFCGGKNVNVEKFIKNNGTTEYSINADGLNQRLSYTPLDNGA